MGNVKVVTRSYPVLGLLGIILCVLKATGNTDLSWFYCTMPFWIGLAVGLTVLAGGLLLVFFAALLAVLLGK